jgi:serine/threonine protein kinase
MEVSTDEHCIYLVLEYVDGGELYEKIKLEGRVSEHQAKIWFKQLIEAVAYIHKVNRIIIDDIQNLTYF